MFFDMVNMKDIRMKFSDKGRKNISNIKKVILLFRDDFNLNPCFTQLLRKDAFIKKDTTKLKIRMRFQADQCLKSLHFCPGPQIT